MLKSTRKLVKAITHIFTVVPKNVNNVFHHIPVLGLFPARMREISSPRLKAWLNMRRVWNVDMNGNHENMAMGMKISIPIPASYSRAIERTDFHSPNFFIKGFQAAAIWKPDSFVLKCEVEREPQTAF